MIKIQKSASFPTTQNPKLYDLEDRTFEFAKASRAFVKRLPRTIANNEDEEAVYPRFWIDRCKLHRGKRVDWKERLRDEG